MKVGPLWHSPSHICQTLFILFLPFYGWQGAFSLSASVVWCENCNKRWELLRVVMESGKRHVPRDLCSSVEEEVEG